MNNPALRKEADAREGTERTHQSFALFSTYRSVLMGLQIAAIVFFHFTEDCKAADVNYDGFIRVFYTFIRSSGVDMFLLLSGLGLYYSWKRSSAIHSFYSKRLVRLLVPYAIVAVPAWAAFYCLSGRYGVVNYLSDVLFFSFFLDGQRWLWYICFAAICYLLFPWLYRCIEEAATSSDELLRAASLCALSLLLAISLKLFHEELYSNVVIAIARIPSFILGIVLGKKSYEARRLSLSGSLVMLFVAMFVVGPLGFSNVSLLGYYARAFLNYAICRLLILALFQLSVSSSTVLATCHEVLTRGLSWLGRYTLEIYMTHVVLRRFFSLFGWHTWRLSYELLLIVSSVILSIILQLISKPLQKRVLAFFCSAKSG